MQKSSSFSLDVDCPLHAYCIHFEVMSFFYFAYGIGPRVAFSRRLK